MEALQKVFILSLLEISVEAKIIFSSTAGGVEVEIRERVIPFPPRLPAHGKSIQTSKVITNFVHPTPVHPALVPSSTSSFSFAVLPPLESTSFFY